MPDTLEGLITQVIYRNDANGYTVFELETAEEEITCVGFFDSLNAGETVELFGRFTEHASYGRQFRADRYEIRVPKEAAAIERYLASGAVRGIGERLAHRIVERFGDDTLAVMRNEPERLAEVKGISMRIAQDIAAQVEEQAGMRDVMMFLQEYGISLALGIRIYKEYGLSAIGILKENPYRLAEDIDGIGFKTADGIAGKLGIRADASYRIRSALLYILMTAAQEGSVYLPKDILLARTAELLELPGDVLDIEVGNLAIDRKVVLKRPRGGDGERPVSVYHSHYYYLEQDTARMLTERNVLCETEEEASFRKIDRILSAAPVQLEEEQKEAVRYAARYGVTILTGGPGTGKTTVVSEILRYFDAQRMDVLLAAPTGRAARRMTETTGYEASTIHRLLELSPQERDDRSVFTFGRNADNPLEADVIIVDEMSMVDISLMHALLTAVAPGTRLVLVGDVDQLPSVGPGRVLADLIEAGIFPTVRLTRIFRQASTSDIVVNAHRINAGEQPVLDNRSRDFFFLPREDVSHVTGNLIALIRDKLPTYVDAPWNEIQVLTPMRKGALGVERLNAVLQQHLNPPAPDKAERECGSVVFRVGDKVMQIRNNYQIEWEIRGRFGIAVEQGTGIFNGDIGRIIEIDSFSKTVSVEYDEGKVAEYSDDALGELELAYAVTIHKSQGSEYPAVLLPLLGGPGLLFTRKLLYTAVTRARKCVVILGREDVVRRMVDNHTEQVRYTSLADRILEIHEVTADPDL